MRIVEGDIVSDAYAADRDSRPMNVAGTIAHEEPAQKVRPDAVVIGPVRWVFRRIGVRDAHPLLA